jgi:hypothetical protein
MTFALVCYKTLRGFKKKSNEKLVRTTSHKEIKVAMTHS